MLDKYDFPHDIKLMNETIDKYAKDENIKYVFVYKNHKQTS